MHNLQKRLEIITNIAVIVVAILIVGVITKNYFFPVFSSPNKSLSVGTKISLPDIDWAKNGQTMLLVVSKGCHYCTESAPFYQRLVKETTVQWVALLPQGIEEGKKYISSLGVTINEVQQANLEALGVSGTPTLILVDGKGLVIDTWIGKLPPEIETEVLTRLQNYKTAQK